MTRSLFAGLAKASSTSVFIGGERIRVAAMATKAAGRGFVGPVAETILEKVRAAFACEEVDLANQSHLHAGHTGNPTGAADAETHFKLRLVSDSFDGKKLIQRHRMVNEVLKQELETTVHALSLVLKTPSEIKK
jgi:stress-induced morphogen